MICRSLLCDLTAHAIERDCQKINLYRLLTDLGVQLTGIRLTGGLIALPNWGKNLGGSTDQFRFQLRNLVHMHVILYAQLDQRFFALDCRQDNFRLEN